MKFKAFLLALPLLGAFSIPANADPVQLQGNQGVYTIDLEAGTYYGCVDGNGCLSLGPSQRVGLASWQNGDYLYEVGEEGVFVYQGGILIFSDYIYAGE